MHNCTFCGSELPENARFCGRCGHVMDTSDTAYGGTSSSDAPFPYPPAPAMPGAPSPSYPPAGATPGMPPTWYPSTSTPPYPQTQDEERKNALPWSPFYGAGMAAG